MISGYVLFDRFLHVDFRSLLYQTDCGEYQTSYDSDEKIIIHNKLMQINTPTGFIGGYTVYDIVYRPPSDSQRGSFVHVVFFVKILHNIEFKIFNM